MEGIGRRKSEAERARHRALVVPCLITAALLATLLLSLFLLGVKINSDSLESVHATGDIRALLCTPISPTSKVNEYREAVRKQIHEQNWSTAVFRTASDPSDPNVSPEDSDGAFVEAPASESGVVTDERAGGASQSIDQASVGISPMAAPVSVATWDQLRTAMSDVTIDTIIFSTNITRVTQTTTAYDLPAISRTLTIDGNGYTLNMNANAVTAVNRLGFVLGGSADQVFTLKNMTIVRASSIYYPLVGYTAATSISTSANSRYWTVNFNNVSSSGASSPLVNVSDGIVNFTGTNSWDMNINYQMMNARVVQFNGGTHKLDSQNTGAESRILRMQTYANNTTYPVELSAINGARVTLTTQSNNQVVYVNSEARDNVGNTPAFITVTDNSLLDIEGVGYGTGATGAALAVCGGSGGYTITNGGVLRVHALREGAGQPAIIQQIPSGNFVVDGAGSQLEARSWGASNNIGSALRFRLVGNQTFTVSNNARVTIVKERKAGTTATGSDAAGLRFGSATGNNFVVNSGGWVLIDNYGNGTRYNPGTGDGYNVGVEYDADSFGYNVTGYLSSVEIIARAGAAVNAKNLRYGTIYVGPGAIFVASGHPSTNAAGSAAFRASGGGTSFTMNNPLYYDFVNMFNSDVANIATTGGRVFNLSDGDTFKSLNSDVAVWRVGVNRVTGSPDADWTLITYELSGVSLRTVTSDSPSFIQYYNSGANYTTRAENFSRISGNNAPPVVSELVDATNADKYVRALGHVPEGRNLDGRPYWTDEVWGTFEVAPVEGGPSYQVTSTGTFSQSLVRSYISQTLYEVQQNVKTLEGVLQLRRADGGLLHAGDTYTITEAWRSVNSGDVKRHDAVDTLPQSIIVRDVTPPVPAHSNRPSIQDWQTTITGTWTLANTYDNGPVDVVAYIRHGATAFVPLAGAGTVNPNGTWTFEIASTGLIAHGDIIALRLIDSEGNMNPLTDTPYRDTTFPSSAQIVVVQGHQLPYIIRYYYAGIEDSLAMHVGYVNMPGATIDIGVDFPDKVKQGYRLDHTVPVLPTFIDENNYEVRVYYEPDPAQVATIAVQYYFDGVQDVALNKTITPQVLSIVDLSMVALDPRPRSYVLDDPPTDKVLPASALSLHGSTIKVSYVSTLQELIVQKRVDGIAPDTSRLFAFTLTILDSNGRPVPAGQAYEANILLSSEETQVASSTVVTDGNGRIGFSLADGGSITLVDVASIKMFRVVETEEDAYIASFVDSDVGEPAIESNDTGVLAMTADDRTVTFTNTHAPIIPAGFRREAPVRNALIIGLLLLIGFVGMRVASSKTIHAPQIPGSDTDE